MEKLVTIVMPVYNTGLSLGKSVNSVLQSSYHNIECLIIDDGSDKETADFCDLLAKKDGRIKVIHQKNGGVSAARNTGLKYAKGDYLVFVDADDLVEADMISSLADIAERENADVVVGGYRECYGDGRKKEFGCNRKTVISRGEGILTDFFTTNIIGWNVWAKLYRRNSIKSIRFVEGKKVAEDMFFVYQTLKVIDTIAIYGFPIYRYIKNDDSAMADTNSAKFFDSFYLTRAVFNDSETDEMHKNEKVTFYIRNALFFFRFIYTKDKAQKVRTEIYNAKRIFLEDIEKYKANTNLRMKLEILMLKRASWLFKVYARNTWGRKI